MAANILIVEDDPFLGKLLKKKFTDEGWNVHFADNGEDGEKLAIQEEIDCMILDLILPKKTGFHVLKNLRANASTAKLPILVLSALGQDSDITKAKELGANNYSVKSNMNMDDIVQAAKDLLA